ncbi:MAG: ribonuclease E inhibitor RraB [Myxococcota bacterium]|nr:ribonuclease E inhibitor RraB [Myxococcota bacterium]
MRRVLAVCLIGLAGCEQSPPRPVVLEQKAPEQLDREALEDLIAAGGDPKAAQTLRHVLFFPSAQKAQQAAPALEVLGYKVTLRRSPSAPPGRQFLIHAETTAVPSLEYLQRSRASLGQLTRKVGGVYDGWELLVASGSDAGVVR